jgi:branched-chain amino acid transport system permease protein
MISIEVLAQVMLGGVLIGGLDALVAFGLSLIYGVVFRILNFSHGTLLAVGESIGIYHLCYWGISLSLMTLFVDANIFCIRIFIF